jgi:polyisoprenoid-binding protein YceI
MQNKTINAMIKSFFGLATAAVVLVACQSAPKADKAEASDVQVAASASGTVLNIDTAASVVTWIGTKPVGQHTGTFSLDSGSLAVANGTITGGQFVIDVASLNSTDMTGKTKNDLDGHLKSADFFEVEKYPTARFEITKVEPFDSTKSQTLLTGATHLISGNLTLKNNTKNVTFPAVVSLNGDAVEAKANFNIDRTQWGLSYGNDQSLGDKFIRPEVNISLDIKARR